MIANIELAKTFELHSSSQNPKTGDSLFTLNVISAATGHLRRYEQIHVAKNLQVALRPGGVCELHVITIDVNALCTYILPGRPRHILTGVDFVGGNRLGGLPQVVKWCRRFGIISTLASICIGSLLIFRGWAACGLAISICGAYFLRTFENLPDRPFWGHEDDQ